MPQMDLTIKSHDLYLKLTEHEISAELALQNKVFL